jgi:ABC-type multidrug transport system ATPase subunit
MYTSTNDVYESEYPSDDVTKTSPDSPSSSLHLRWSRLHKTAQITEEGSGLLRGSIAGPTPSRDLPKAPGSSTKTILSEVSGSAAPGSVLCLMGPSGSGKTTLLNCLSGRTHYDSGVISVNGVPLTAHMKKRLMTKIAYVKQADIFFTHLTVRDQLLYTAFLRLPQAWSKEKKLQEVDKILQLLRLTKIADSEIRLISGGEKKRTNIGTELLTDPCCLLLDEPTSGLDSTSAVALMQVLQNLARLHNKTVITSIHQPSSKVFFSFDQLMLLAEGHAVYFGTPDDSLDYLRNHNLACPVGYNVADYWMDMLVTNTHAPPSSPDSTMHDSTDMSDIEDVKPNHQFLIEAWDNDAIAIQMDHESEEQQKHSAKDGVTEEATKKKHKISKYNTTWGMQYRVLVHRAFKNSRSAIFTPLNMIKSAALGLMVGLLYFQMPYTESAVFDRNS